MERIVGSPIVDGYTVLDLNDAPLTGMTKPADVTLTLQRQSGTTIVAAAEATTWTEIGATGRYYFSFTPLNSGLYLLYLAEINVNTALRQREFRYDVVSAGAATSPSYTNAFCSESDIEAYLNTAISATSNPNDTVATLFAEQIADILEALTARLGYPQTPSTVTAGAILTGLLRAANAVGAALYYRLAQEHGVSQSLSEKPDRLWELWRSYVGEGTKGETGYISGIIADFISGNLASLSTDHILSGDTLAWVESLPAAGSPIGVSMRDVF